MHKKMRTIAVTLLLLFSLTVSVFADTLPYRPYTYDKWGLAWGNSVAAPGGYEPSRTIDGVSLGVGPMSSPEDIFYCEGTQKFYILDSQNNRIIITDRNFENAKSLDKFFYDDGFEEELKEPEGIFVTDDGTIYVADSQNYRVMICDETGLVKNVLNQPDTSYFPEDKSFTPVSIVVDSVGTIYVTCEGVYNGALMMDQNNQFLGYFGSNEVKITPQLLINRFWKSILSNEAGSKIADYIPVEMSSLEIGKDDFLYTCTVETDDNLNSIRKINPYGTNILEVKAQNSFQKGFGDFIWTESETTYQTRFVDIAVDDKEHIFALDATYGRVFRYDEEGNLLFTFGGIGNQEGLFYQPSALETLDENVYVLDSSNNNITEFRPTQFGNTLLEAISLYHDGNYEDSVEVWNEVLKMDSNYTLAYVGIGKAFLEAGDYKAAMENFERGNDQDGYNMAFKEARAIAMRQYFPLITVVIVLLFLFLYRRHLPYIGKKFFTKKEKKEGQNRFLDPLRLSIHPIEGFQELFYKKRGSILVGALMALLLFIIVVLDYQYQGFLFTDYNKQEMNILFLFIQTILLLVLFTAVNWAITTLFNGKGRLAEIWVAVTYALFPLLVCSCLKLILSNVLLQEEGVFLTILLWIGYGWTGFLLLKGLEACHQYSMKGTVASVVCSAVGLFIIAFVFVLLLSLTQQIISFISTVIQEVSLR